MRRLALALLLSAPLAAVPLASAQTRLGPLEVGGSVSVSGEGYSVSGIEARRPGLLGRLNADARFGLFGLGSRLSLSLATDEGAEFRRELDRIRLATRWSWGEAELGDVAPSLSPYVLSGLTPRGGLLQLRGRGLELTAGGGRTRQAVLADAAESGLTAYEQWLWAGRARYGNARGTFGGLALAVARDLPGSLEASGEGAAPIVLRPRASATLAPEAGVALMGGALRLRGLAAVSGYTPDLEAPVGEGDVPAFIEPFLATRAGAFAQTAYEGDLSADLAALGLAPDLGLRLDASYSRVPPGYRTLGVPRLRDDEATLRLRPRAQLFDRRLTVSVDLARTATDLGRREIADGRRLSFGTSVQARPTDWLALTAAYSGLQTTREAGVFGAGDEAVADPGLDQRTQTFTLAPSLTLRQPGGLTHTATLATTLMRARDLTGTSGAAPDAPLAPEADNATAAVSYAFAAPSGLSLTATADGARSALGDNTTTRAGLTLGAGQAFLDRTLQLAATAGASRTEAAYAVGGFTQTQVTGSLTGTYRFPTGDALRLQVNGFSSAADSGAPSFRELRARVVFSRRF